MKNNNYNKNSLEAVTQGSKVGSYPNRAFLCSIKTTLILTLLIINNSFSDDFINEIHSAFNEFNKNKVVVIEYDSKKPESAEEAEVRVDRERDHARDVALNKAEVREQRYWVNGGWYSPNNPTTATNEAELKDSDNDGYDDYTEFKYGTSPYDPKLFPAIRQGNNKKIF